MNALPIIPWIGGKRRLADRLIPLFPQHTCYVEVFCGGAALFFLRPQQADVEVINNINGELVRLYRVVQNHLEEFVRQFKWALSSRQIFEWQQMTPPRDADRYPTCRPFLLPATACLRWQSCWPDVWYGHNRTGRA